MGVTEGIQSAAVTACGVAGAAVSDVVLPGSGIVVHWLAGITIATIGGIVIKYLTTPAAALSGGTPQISDSSDVKKVVGWGWWLFQSLPYAVQSTLVAATALYSWQKWKEWSTQKSETSSPGVGSGGGNANVTVHIIINGREKRVSRV